MYRHRHRQHPRSLLQGTGGQGAEPGQGRVSRALNCHLEGEAQKLLFLNKHRRRFCLSFHCQSNCMYRHCHRPHPRSLLQGTGGQGAVRGHVIEVMQD